ncbi:centrosomal protein of 68 kDa isoform X2 [Pseudoliparis swirei]|uniref:centrosomal protein of 68 kDa isoform X2 n=1 Tax=Pseudoliparis swirei TaxID=2059687 RepID=UPI0024BE0CA7|nr:centrosomal protein of 68 kDa isoform X2 [Pseudoliparis swirei]
MERNPRWKMHLPEFKPGPGWPSPTPKDVERGEVERGRDRGEPHKGVTMAPTSRCLTGRRYVTRRPLFPAEQHASILKKTHPQKHTEKEKHLGVGSGEDEQQRADANILTGPRVELTPESFSLSHSDVFRTEPGSALGVSDLGATLRVSDLGAKLRHEEHASGHPGSRSAQRSLSSSALEVQRLSPPRRPQLTSTVLYPTYTPRSGHSTPGQTQVRLKGRERGTFSSGGDVKGLPMSPHQANYWACAIPKALPPSPDRHSAGWDPNREYQALLDYTYPLRPGQVVCEGDGSKLRSDSLLQTGRHLQDSGIELDHLCSSTSLSGLDFSLGAGHRSLDKQGFNKSSEGPDPMDLSLDSSDCIRNEGGMSLSDGHSSSSAASSRCASALPRPRGACREMDEEFRPLPDQLEELQLLSRRVRDVTAQLSRPFTTSWESLEPGATPTLSPIPPEKREAEDDDEEEEEEEATVRELAGGNQDPDEGKDEMGREDRSAAHTADHRDSETVRRTSGACEEPGGDGRGPFSPGEVEVLAEQLCGLTLPGGRTSSRDDREGSDSLMQHIQVFGSHLEQLIQQLYAVSEKMEQLAAPTVDIDDVKSSLAEYQSFQREVSSHQPLTACVLHTGWLLLGCINSTSPLLRDALLLIERRRGALETTTEHFFSSILSAMDSLTRPGPVQQSRGPAGARGATL